MKNGQQEAEISQVNRFIVQLHVKIANFQDGGQTVNFRTKVYRSSIKDLQLRQTKIETKWKLDNQKLRYHGFYISHLHEKFCHNCRFFKMAAKIFHTSCHQTLVNFAYVAYLLAFYKCAKNNLYCNLFDLISYLYWPIALYELHLH